MRMTAEDHKLYLYRFDGKGYHSGKIDITDATHMVAIVERAMEFKETITITDEDDCCVFRCEQGVVCWPRVGPSGVIG